MDIFSFHARFTLCPYSSPVDLDSDIAYDSIPAVRIMACILPLPMDNRG